MADAKLETQSQYSDQTSQSMHDPSLNCRRLLNLNHVLLLTPVPPGEILKSPFGSMPDVDRFAVLKYRYGKPSHRQASFGLEAVVLLTSYWQLITC